jgi:glucose-1-phosphate thymidylyltransferase
MKIIIPVAGVGSRLKPHTFVTPKPLMEVAGKPILTHIIEKIEELEIKEKEYIFVVSHKKEDIINFIEKKHSNLKKKFVEQKVRDGDGGAIKLGLESLSEDELKEDLLIFFGDILIDFDLNKAIKNLKKEDFGIIFTKEVGDPTHYGIVEINTKNKILSIEEKPKIPRSNLAVIGTYYFKKSKIILNELSNIYEKKEMLKGEYKIAKVIENLATKKEYSLKSFKVKGWFDCGRVEVLLESNKYFLKKNSSGKKYVLNDSNIIIPPCFISKTAKINNSVIGPNVSIGSKAIIDSSIIENSIISSKSEIVNSNLKDSLIGREVKLNGKKLKVNIGEKSEVLLE